MDLLQIMNKLNLMDDFIPTDLPDRSTTIRLEEYCKKHPYFERTVRQINSMFHYIPFSEVLDTMNYLVNNEFETIIRRDMETNHDVKYVFLYEGNIKSGFYFSLLFLKHLSAVLDNKYWNRVWLQEYTNGKQYNDPNIQYVLVDDASYSGHQMEYYAKAVPNPIIALITISQEAYDRLSSIEGSKLIVGSIQPNIFAIETDDIFRNLDIFYLSQGVVYSLLNETLGSGYEEDAVSGFYFQHKFPDYVSIPQTLVRFPDPDVVDRILTLEEKYSHLGLDNDGTYVRKEDYDVFNSTPQDFPFSFILTDESWDDPYTPFYKQDSYAHVLD